MQVRKSGGLFRHMMALIKLAETFPEFKLGQELRIKLEYFSLIEKFILAIKFQNNKE